MKYIALILLTLIVSACSSIDLPTIDESNKVILESNTLISKLDSQIVYSTPIYNSKRTMNLGISLKSINKILSQLANQKTEDINILFHNSPGFYTENKSVLGVSYTNALNIESGQISMDLKKLVFLKLEGSKLFGQLELQGNGKVSISGKYLGIPASASPDLSFYLLENIGFNLKTGQNGNLLLQVIPQKVKLKTKISVKLLEWSIPYYKEIELELSDLIKPIEIPSNITSEIPFPVPAKSYGKDRIEMVPFKVNFKDALVNLTIDNIEYQSNIEFERK